MHNTNFIKSHKKDKGLSLFLKFEDEVLYFLFALSLIANFFFLWSHIKFMSMITAEEPVCAIEEISKEKAGEFYCKEYRIVKRQDGSLVVTKINK